MQKTIDCGEYVSTYDPEKHQRSVVAKDDSFHLYMNTESGITMKYGKTHADDPTHCPWGPEIADVEITTACNGIRDKDGNRAPCAFCCTPDTMIRMADGTEKRIDEIEVGDKVRSYDKDACKFRISAVTEVYVRNYTGELVTGTAYTTAPVRDFKLPKTTQDHPYMVWKPVETDEADQEDMLVEVEANQLKKNNELLLEDERVGFVSETAREQYSGPVFNFHCVPNENYFANGILVHNCYKGNQPSGLYMSIDVFRRIFAQLNRARTLTQIAFGVDAQCATNPDVWKIMDHCLENDVTPNVTVADIDEQTAENIVSRCGACAVSVYQRNPEVGYDSVGLLTKAARKLNKPFFKVNVHLMIAQETFGFCKEVLAHVKDKANDKRIADLNAVVMLGLKTKGRGEGWHVLTQEQFNELVDYAMANGVRIGMDSCSVNKFIAWMGDDEAKKKFYMPTVESCESLLYSVYVNVNGRMFPCSFLEDVNGDVGLDLNVDEPIDFWHSERAERFRVGAIGRIRRNGCNSCPYYKV